MIGCSPLEADFFRTGERLAERHDFSDLDAGYQRPSLWRAVVGWVRGIGTRQPE